MARVNNNNVQETALTEKFPPLTKNNMRPSGNIIAIKLIAKILRNRVIGR